MHKIIVNNMFENFELLINGKEVTRKTLDDVDNIAAEGVAKKFNMSKEEVLRDKHKEN